jgi:hypothetical protein
MRFIVQNRQLLLAADRYQQPKQSRLNTTNPKDFIELLEVFSIALTNGLMDKNDVIKWADNIIINDNEPDFFIIELSLCGHKNLNDIISLLNEFIGPEKPQVSSRVILGFVHRQYLVGKITLRKVVGVVDSIVWKTDLTDEEKSFMYGLDDNYNCAEEGIYGSVEVVEKETIRFLEIYKEFQIDNYNEWRRIDSTIEGKIKVLSDIVKRENEEFKKDLDARTKRKWWELW